ncbi:MAG: YceD family protein [Ilumatobacteraceae bacterium]
MASPLLVNAAELLRRPGTEKAFDLAVPLEAVGVVDDARFDADAEVSVHLRLESLTDGVVVDGTIEVPWHGTCRRCLLATGGTWHSEVRELYQRVRTDPDAFDLEGDQFDLAAMVREIVLLDVPSTPLCRPDCAGLCPTCGANRNDEACGCAEAPADPRWAALDQLRGLGGDEAGPERA